jgi:hypothetical protein
MLQAIDQLIPALRKLAETEKPESHRSPNRLPSLLTEFETVQAPGAISQETDGGVLERSDSPSAIGIMTDRAEPNPRDYPMLGKGKEQTRDVDDNPSPSDYLPPELTRAVESTGASAPANSSTRRIGVGAGATKIQKDSPFGAASGLTESAHRQLSKARFWLSTTMKHTLGSLLSIATPQLRISIPVGLRLKLRVLFIAAVPAAVLLIMLVFLFLITATGRRSNATAATSETSATAKLVRAREPSQGLHQRSAPVPAYQLSHMQVTDPAMSSALRTLSRYEIVGLRRRAVYGDDSAALLLGMAYETGHLVPQNCVKAGEWVTKSANEGNAAAQYNLGLRYRHGDGEPVNQEVGARWLRKAAAQKYSQAQLALESVP